MYRPRKQAILRGFQHEDGAPSVVADELTTTELTGVSPWVTYYHVNTPTSHPHTT
jgi:hypothetical protein